MELYKNALNLGLTPEFYFYRDQHTNEVDLIFEAKGGLMPIEIKSSQTIVEKMLKPIKSWCETFEVKDAVALYGGTDVQIRSNVKILPVTSILN